VASAFTSEPSRRITVETLDENAAVVSASKVTGTNVYNTDGDHLGEIYDVMLEKRSGNIAYAVM